MAAAAATWHNAAVRVLGLLLALPGCGGGLPVIVQGSDIPEAGGAPSLEGVLDLGGRAKLSPGPLVAEGPSDGAAAIGELLLLRGSDLGRMPTIAIGGEPATIEATTTAGVIVRVPPGVPPGAQRIVLEHAGGRAEGRFPVRRWALLVADGAVHPLAVDAAGLHAFAPIPVAGARAVRFSADGSVAYVLGDELVVIDAAAQGGPRVVARRELPAPVEHLVVARDRQASRAALVSQTTLVMIDVRAPYQPAFWTARPLPAAEADPVAAVELDDTGKSLALLAGNRLSIVDVSDVANPTVRQTVDVLPGVRPPLGTHLRFADESLWVLTGENPRSAATGAQPVRLVRVRDGAVDADRAVAEAGAPAGLALSPEGRRVRGATIHASAMSPVLVAARGDAGGSTLYRIDGEGTLATLTTSDGILAMDAAPGAVLAATCRNANLAVLPAQGALLTLPAPCPKGPVALAVQP
jgi:hypothetical protein